MGEQYVGVIYDPGVECVLLSWCHFIWANLLSFFI
jgi:hypothetical protein